MNSINLDYLKSLKPAVHVNGNDILKQGIEMGREIELGKSRFVREGNYSNLLAYIKDCRKRGEIRWNILMGLASLDQQIEATKKLYEFSQRTGMKIHHLQPIPSGVIALPKEYRDNAPSTTSYVMDGYDEYKAQVEASPIDVTFNDYHLASPNGLETTVHSIKAGATLIGEFSQITWGYPGYDDDLTRFSNMVKALGIIASKKDQNVMVKTYLDDGYAGYFMDCASYVGYAMLEHYICTELCGARYIIAFGGLLSENDIRLGVAMALHKALSTEEQPVLHYINSSTNLQWDHDIEANYGMSVQELLFAILVEKKYHMGLGVNPVSITEKIAVPTLQELINILAAGKRAEEKADEWLPFMDFSLLEEMQDVMMEQGEQLFKNVLSGFKLAGIDIEDPLEMILVLRYMNPLRFESMFHPTTFNTEEGEIEPFYPTVLAKQTIEMREGIIENLKHAGLENALKDTSIVVASGDAHTYGLILVEGVFKAMGAEVINGGVDTDAVDLLDLADEEDTNIVCISCHNGQALDYGRQLEQISKERNKEYHMFMGGVLNSILPGHSEPIDVSGMLQELGIYAQNDLQSTVETICKKVK